MESSCSTTVAIKAKRRDQARANPEEAPAAVAVVRVPGPINAAATIAPGPNLTVTVLSWVEMIATQQTVLRYENF